MIQTVTQETTRKTFFTGVLMLSVSTVLVKVIGLLYKIPMLSYLGSEGMGYFNSAYEVYALFCVIATAGLPVALSVLISGALVEQRWEDVRKIDRAATRIFFWIGSVGTLLMYLLARPLCTWIRSEQAYACMISIAPTVFFVCLSSAVRGYFQGFQKMFPTALSQLIESFGKLGFGLLFAHLSLRAGNPTETVAASAGWGLTLGTALSALYLLIAKKRAVAASDVRSEHGAISAFPNVRSVWKTIGRLAVPMTLGASMVSLTKLIDMTMILRRLQSIGYSAATANEAYGSYTTLALSVFGVLPTLLNSVALPLVPMLSAAVAVRDTERQRQMVETSYRLTSFFALPTALGISAFAHPILSFLFRNEPEAVDTAAPLLAVLGSSVFLSCMITATNSVLHAYRDVKYPIVSMAIGAAVKLPVAYVLIGEPSIGLIGAPISSFFCNATVVMLNLRRVTRLSGLYSVRRFFVYPLSAAAVAVAVSFGVYLQLMKRFGEVGWILLLCVMLAAAIYIFFALLGGLITREDLCALPFGTRLCVVAERLRFLPLQSKKRVKK